MEIRMSASGTPSQVLAAIDNQARQIAKESPAAWPIASNLTDAIRIHLSQIAGEQHVEVTASAALAVAVVAAAPTPAPKAAASVKAVTEVKPVADVKSE
jgi:hypothetical protein